MSDGVFKGWVPFMYLDEVCPSPRATPDDWLVVGSDVRLAGFVELDPATIVIADDEIVTFHGLTEFDDVRVTWRSRGDYTIHDAIAPGASCFCLEAAPDTSGMTVGEVIEDLEGSGALEPNQMIVLQSWHWCEGVPFVLRGGKFVTLAAAKAAEH